MSLVWLAGAVLAFAIGVGAASAQSVRVFADWHAACDNLRTCALLGLSPPDAAVSSFLQVRRGGEPGARADVSLVFAFDTELPEIPLEITLSPSAPMPEAFSAAPAARIGRDGLLRLDLPPVAADWILDAARHADHLRIRRLDDAPDDESVTIISFRGGVDALRWMGDQQSSAASLKPPPVHTIAAYQPRLLSAKASSDVRAMWRKTCPDPNAGEELAYEIASETVLWQLPCVRGAHDSGALFLFQMRADPPRAVVFERPLNGELLSTAGELIAGEFNEDERTIFFFRKNRDQGDCGARGGYMWDGRAFRLTMWQEMAECRGAPLDLWPVIWRAQARARR